MQSLDNTSLGNQVAKKISTGVLALVCSIILGLFSVSFFLCQQLFTLQVGTWKEAIPQYALTHLMDSDYYSINNEIKMIKSTGLFYFFIITDNQKRPIVRFGNFNYEPENLIPIKDQAKVVWGYYYYKADFYNFFSPFVFAGVVLLAIVLIFYFIIRWRMQSYLKLEFSRFNQFLREIELLSSKVSEIYKGDAELINEHSPQTAEQIIINRAINHLLDEIKKANRSLREAVSKAEQTKFEEELTKTALQVAHDIGSPLAVLEMVIQSSTSNMLEDSRTSVRNAVSRIRDISFSLLKKAKHDLMIMQGDAISQYLVASLIAFVVSEKQMQYRERADIVFEMNEIAYGLFAMIKAGDFCRIISNLINNAVEALKNRGEIQLALLQESNNVVISIIDNGIGIPRDLIPKLGNLGVTYGKPNGTGIGLYHAKEKVESWGGSLTIQSDVSIGTTVYVTLPKAEASSWFVSAINVISGQTIVVVDDDKCIHDIWKNRFNHIRTKLISFYHPEGLKDWHKTNKPEGNILYLCDHEFAGTSMNGIDLISQLKINYFSILVSGKVEMHDIIDCCEENRIKFLPKNMANVVPIKLGQP